MIPDPTSLARLNFAVNSLSAKPGRSELRHLANIIDKLPYSTFSSPQPRLMCVLGELLEEDLLGDFGFSKIAASQLLAFHSGWEELLVQPLFQLLMTSTVNASLELESLLVKVRAGFLAQFVKRRSLSPEQFRMSHFIGRQGLLNTYVWPETKAEQEWLKSLLELPKPSFSDFVVVSMYRVLHQLPQFQNMSDMEDEELFHKLVSEPLEERVLGATIPSFGMGDCEVTQDVAEHYEQCAYPRWGRLGPPDAPYETRLKQRFSDVLDDKPKRVLVAGCGSGLHPLRLARSNPELAIHAVDISRASLGHAQRMAAALRIRNVSFEHGDLRLFSRVEYFDGIECLGVLHHLAEPDRAWGSLYRALRPGGVLRGAVYSSPNRAIVRDVWRRIEELGLRPTDANARRLRSELLETDVHREVAGWLVDYHSLSGFRDLFFHPHELAWEASEVAEMVDRHGFEFLGFELPPGQHQLYQRAYPEDPGRKSMKNWVEFEQQVCPLFMHHFWVRRPL